MTKIDCKTKLTPGIIDKEVFDRELNICEQLSKENTGSCCWGKCRECGVIPLLTKLHNGELLEEKKDIVEAKNRAGVITDN